MNDPFAISKRIKQADLPRDTKQVGLTLLEMVVCTNRDIVATDYFQVREWATDGDCQDTGLLGLEKLNRQLHKLMAAGFLLAYTEPTMHSMGSFVFRLADWEEGAAVIKIDAAQS